METTEKRILDIDEPRRDPVGDNGGYVERHPNAEVDADRAEHMAYGSKHFEERLVHAGKMAKLSARNDFKGLADYKDQNEYDLEQHPTLVNISSNNRTSRLMDEVRLSRVNADIAATRAGDQYDREQKSYVDDEVDRLMSGKGE